MTYFLLFKLCLSFNGYTYWRRTTTTKITFSTNTHTNQLTKTTKSKMATFKTRACKNGKNCRFFASGRCTFAHPEMGEAVRTTKKKAMPFEPTKTRRKTVLCRSYPQCKFGDRCTFIHPDETPPVLQRSVADPTAFEQLSMLRERAMSVDSDTTERTDITVEGATEDDFDSMELLKEKYGNGEDYLGSWHDSSVKREFQCGAY